MRTLRQERIMRMQKLFLIVMVFLLCGLISLCLFFIVKYGIRREKIRTFQKVVTLKEFDQITLKEKKEADASFNGEYTKEEIVEMLDDIHVSPL